MQKLNIRSTKNLCRHLRCSQNELRKFCEHPDHYYYKSERIIKNKKRLTATPIGRFGEIVCNLKFLLDRVELPDYLHGGIKKHSPKTNAACHVDKSAVLNFDLANFFPNIKPCQVYNLFNNQLGCGCEVAQALTCLITLDGGLPQGSPTSTVVANLVIIPLAERLKGLANKHKCDYSQFVDDGTISGPAYIENLRPLIDKIIKQEGFRASPKPHKRITMYRFEEQIITGVKVNKKIDVSRQKIYEIRSELDELCIMTDSGQKLSKQNIASIKGKIQYVTTLNKEKGKKLENKLKRILKKSSC